MKTFEAVFNEDTKGVFGISLVYNPAMEGNFIALSKEQEIKLAEVDKEQRILMGLVLEPNKPIYRNQGGKEFNIVFNEQTIKDLSFNFFKQGNQHNSTIEHQNRIEGVTFVESWIVEDSKTDKSALYGFSYPKGSWIATMKVDSDEIWNDYVKTGQVQGFSIDAMLELKEVNLKSEIEMNKREFLTELKNIFSFKDDVKEVTETEVTEAVEVQPETPAEAVVEEKVEDEVDMLKELQDVLAQFSKDQDAKFEAFKTEFSKQLADKEKEVVELKAEVVELGKQPASKPVVSTPVALTRQGRILQELRNNK